MAVAIRHGLLSLVSGLHPAPLDGPRFRYSSLSGRAVFCHMFSRPDYTPRVHDLLALKPGTSVELEATNPEWVRAALIQSRFVVARREVAPPGMIAVGVRGPSREQRWAGFVTNEDVHQVIGPGVLRSQNANIARRYFPAIQALRYAEARLRPMTLEWGPVGSVGFELATRLAVTSSESDLDLVIYAPIQCGAMKRAVSGVFWMLLRPESMYGSKRLRAAFSLEEYVRDGQYRAPFAHADWADPNGRPMAPGGEQRRHEHWIVISGTRLAEAGHAARSRPASGGRGITARDE